MIRGGTGGTNTQTGLKFEKRINLSRAFSKIPGYKVKKNQLLLNGQMIAALYSKNKLYTDFLAKKGINWNQLLSKRLLPDQTVYVHENNTLFIIEMKFQRVAGSVDEKLQTCDFKKKQYARLLAPAQVKVEYIYILNDWFKKPEYKDTLNYITTVNCKYFFRELPLIALGLPTP